MSFRTNEEAILILRQLDLFDGERGFIRPSGERGPLTVICKSVLGGWVFTRHQGLEGDFRRLMGELGEPEEIRGQCKGGALEGFRKLETLIRALGLGELISLGLESEDPEVRQIVINIISDLHVN